MSPELYFFFENPSHHLYLPVPVQFTFMSQPVFQKAIICFIASTIPGQYFLIICQPSLPPIFLSFIDLFYSIFKNIIFEFLLKYVYCTH